MSAEQANVIRVMLGAWNRGDIDAVVATATDSLEWHPLVVTAIEGDGHIFRGHAGFREFVEGWTNTWETWNLEVEEFREIGDQLLALTHVTAKGRGSGIEFDQAMAHLFEFDGDLICRAQSFLQRDAAVSFAERRAETA
jgi:ketosteroid isomerase-like protein